MENQIDFLAIGDIVTDAFIKLKDAEAHCDLDSANCKLCVRFGDKVPYESVQEIRAVGNSANAAVAAARLGLKSSLLAHVGNDIHGAEAIEELKRIMSILTTSTNMTTSRPTTTTCSGTALNAPSSSNTPPSLS